MGLILNPDEIIKRCGIEMPKDSQYALLVLKALEAGAKAQAEHLAKLILQFKQDFYAGPIIMTEKQFEEKYGVATWDFASTLEAWFDKVGFAPETDSRGDCPICGNTIPKCTCVIPEELFKKGA